MKIIVCFDGSENSKRALEKTMDLFKPLKPKLMLSMVSEIPSSFSADAIERGIAYDKKVFSEALELVKKQGMDVEPLFFEERGDARHMIMNEIKSKSPDLVVFGKRGRGRLEEMIMGSVSSYFVRHAPCPVLVIH